MRIEQAHGDDVWIVAPTPGYVIKFKEIDISRDIGGAEFRKCFVNVCHCSQLPPPTEDIDEDTLATRLDSGDLGYRIPISIGEIDCVRDNKNDNAVKIDVLVNSVFFESRLAPPSSQFFRHFFCMVMCEAIENKHGLKLNPKAAIKLQNRLKMGDIEQMRIFKRPPAPVIVEVDENMDMQEPQEDIDTSGICIRLLKGDRLEINLSLKELRPPCKKKERIRLRINDDRVLVLLDNSRSLFDFCVPFKMDPLSVRSKLLVQDKALLISCRIVYS